MIGFLVFTGFVFTCGAVIGATILRDWIDRPRRPSVPLARTIERPNWKQLEIPALRRRTRIPVVRL